VIPCPECKRHLRESELRCLFCGADVKAANVDAGSRSFGAFVIAAFVCLGSSACAKDPSADGNTTTTNTTVDDSSDTGMTSETTATDTDDETTNTTTPSGSFYAPPDDFTPSLGCDPWVQDCPEGEKCVPYSSTGGNWDANKCVPVTGSGSPGDACTYGGTVEATDDCDGTSICWDVMLVDDQPIGTCTPFCTGLPDAPSCGPDTTCLIGYEGSVNVCINLCDPLAQDCGAGLGCYWEGEAFVCVATPGELELGDACEFINDCPPGGFCAAAAQLPACAGDGCCTAYCSIVGADCPAGTECVPFFEEPVAGFEDLGICALP
jgi:hypothetical protein